MPEATIIFHPDNSQTLEISELTGFDPVTGTSTYLGAGANVRATVQTKADGLAVAGLSDLVFTYRNDGTGTFFYAFDGSELSNEAERYEVRAHGDDGAGSTFSWTLPLRVRVRRSGDLAAA